MMVYVMSMGFPKAPDAGVFCYNWDSVSLEIVLVLASLDHFQCLFPPSISRGEIVSQLRHLRMMIDELYIIYQLFEDIHIISVVF